MVRTYLCPVSEEESDLSQVVVRVEYFQAIVRGYLLYMAGTTKTDSAFKGKEVAVGTCCDVGIPSLASIDNSNSDNSGCNKYDYDCDTTGSLLQTTTDNKPTSSTPNTLTTLELSHIIYAGKFMIYMQALRFLTDYLNNDVYYGARYKGNNLYRALNQFRLLECYCEKESEMKEWLLAEYGINSI